jgi:vancomycin resistance protein YoaR
MLDDKLKSGSKGQKNRLVSTTHKARQLAKKTIKFFKRPSCRWLGGFVLGLTVSILVLALSFDFYYQQRFYQGVMVDQVNLGGLTFNEAKQKLEQQETESTLLSKQAVIYYEDRTQTISLEEVVQGKDYEQALKKAFNIGRQGGFFKNTQTIVDLLEQPQNIKSEYRLNHALLQQNIAQLKQKVDQDGKNPQFELQTSNNPNSLVYIPGEDKISLEADQTLQQAVSDIRSALYAQTRIDPKIQAVVVRQNLSLNDQQLEQARQRAQAFVGKKITFVSQEVENDQLPDHPIIQKTINDQQLIKLLNWPSGYNQAAMQKLINTWAQEINQPPSNAVFEYNPDTLAVTAFKPHEFGLELNQEKTTQQLEAALAEIENKQTPAVLSLVLQKAEPKISLADTNDLGINELIGFGETYYYHSIPSRIHNVKVTADKLNLTIVPPGEEFSFVKTIGPVNAETGYQQAYVIRSGSTLLEFGGGVCQVSTTTFRALLNAGLNITRRLPHSYRVSYYELNQQPGFDATVYAGNVDLRFINDTPGHILIYSKADSERLYMTVKIYGTDDGRTTEIKNYKKYGYTPPPEPEYIPTDTLLPGEVKQVENAVAGIKARFDWIVRNASGAIIREKTFYSNYQAWGAKYLVGE